MAPRPSRLSAAVPALPIGDSTVPGISDVLALANNENVHAPSSAVQAACAAAAAAANWYPDVTAASLRQAIASRHRGIDPARVVVGAGAGELISLLASAYCDPGDEVVIGEHGYLYFSIASLATGARPVTAAARRGRNWLGFDVQAALDAVTPRTKIVWVDNPGNPLGTYLGHAALLDLRAGLPAQVLLVLDCAYGDFATAADYDFGDGLVRAADNTVVLRTFSKIHGLAGLRVGWAHAPANVCETLLRVQRPGNVSRLALAGAEAALGEPALIAERRRENARVRAVFTRALVTDLGLVVLPSETNFVLVTWPTGAAVGAEHCCAALMAEGILVRAMGPYGLPDSLRITIGTGPQMERVLAALRRALH